MKTYQPLPDSLYIGESNIHGQGLIAKSDIPVGTDLGVSHYRKGNDVIRTPLGGFINHSDTPNLKKVQDRKLFFVYTIVDIPMGSELCLKYEWYKL